MTLKLEQRQPLPEWLEKLNLERFDEAPLLLDKVTERSLYYPACGFDGRPVQFLSGFVHSFIYADYGVRKQEVLSELNEPGFHGYEVAAFREVGIEELGLQPFEIPGERRSESERRAPFARSIIQPFSAFWLIFRRRDGFGDQHGPSLFSLLYCIHDGVAVYENLFSARKSAPLILAIIQPGDGFGGNYCSFKDEDGLLAGLVKAGSVLPEYLVCGGIGLDYVESFWPNMFPQCVERFQHATGNGIWRRKDVGV